MLGTIGAVPAGTATNEISVFVLSQYTSSVLPAANNCIILIVTTEYPNAITVSV